MEVATMIASRTDSTTTDFAALRAEQYCDALRQLDAVAHEPVQMKLLAWVMGLPAGIDPADAARLVLGQQQAGISAPLMKLVETVAAYPRARLAQMVTGRRRAALN
ncbi:hypothetical protein [Dongia mobilis]|uniref:hypothetical protein n=1 Tax=Dongia mobilis TaxID=578943 RepID=UPI00105FF590|nr:hypothetical protein [Dongia mobilis]